MTSATNPGNYVDFDEYVGLKLEKTRSTIRTTDLLTAAAGVAALFLGYLLIFVVLDQWAVRGGFGVFWRWILLSGLLISNIAWLVWKMGIPAFRTVNGLFAAQEIEKAQPELKSNLLNLVDLKAAGRPVNPVIMKALERQAAIRLQQVDVSQAIDHRPLVRTAYVLLAIIVVFCFYAMLSPKKISNSIWRGLLPAAEVPLATITEILDVKPGDLTVPAHQPSVEVQVDLAGEIPAKVLLIYSTTDGQRDQTIELHSEQEGQPRFRGQLIGESGQGLVQELTYFIQAGDASSRPYKIHVEQPPSADIESVHIEFPGYMKLPPVEQAHNGAVDAWEGAKVLINAKANMPIRSAMIQFMDDPQVGPTGEEVLMSVTGSGRQLQATWTLTLRADGTFPKYYRIHCRTEDGRVTTGHVINPLTIRPDLPPEVVLLHPDRDIDAPANATIPLLIQTRDPDFEMGYVYLNIEKSGQKILRDQLSEGRQSKLVLKHELALARLNPAVGDTIELWIEAYDNKQPRPNSKNTPKIKIRIVPPVSPKEAEQQLADQKERRDQKVAEADPDTNSDQPDAAPSKDEGPQDHGKPNDARPPEPNPPEQPPQQNPQDNKAQEGQQGQQGQNKQAGSGKKSQSGEAQQGAGQPKETKDGGSGKAKEDNDSSKGPSSQNGKSRKPLNNDGSQDDEVIRQISERLNKDKSSNPQQPNNQSQSDEPETKPAADQKTDGKKAEQPSSEGGSQTEKDKNGQDPNSKSSKKSESKDKSEGQDSHPNESGENRQKDSQRQDDAGSEPNPSAEKADKPNDKGLKAGDSKTEPTSSEDQSKNGSQDSTDSKGADKQAGKPEQKPEPNKQGGQVDKSNDQGDKSDASKTKSDPKEAPPKNAAQETTPQDLSKEEKSNGKKGEKPEAKSDQQEQNQSGSKSDSEDAKMPETNDDEKNSKGNRGSKSKPNPQSPDDAAKSKEGSSDQASQDKGVKEQVPDSPDSKKGKPDGTEQGTAKPDRDPNSKPTKSKNEKVKRDPNEKPETRPQQDPTDSSNEQNDGASKSPSGKNSPDDSQPSKSGDKSAKTPGEKADGSQSDQNEPAKDKPEGQKQGSADDKQKPGSEKSSNDPQGRPSDIQKSQTKDGKPSTDGQNEDKKKPDSAKDSQPGDQDEKPQSEESEQGKKSAEPNKPETTPTKGDQAGGDKNKPGNDSSKGKKSDQRGKKPDSGKSDSGKSESGKSDSGKSEKSQSGQGDSDKGDGKEGSQGEGKKPGGKSSKTGSQNNPAGTGSTSGDSDGETGNSGDASETLKGDDPNLEYNRQATELILQKLKKDLDRGDVDPELLEQLGWTQTEMKQFADRLSKSLRESKHPEDSTESKARQQQFQEMLKNLDLQSAGTQRAGEKEPKRDLNQVESKRTPPPPAYRSAFEKYTRDLNRQKPAAGNKSAK